MPLSVPAQEFIAGGLSGLAAVLVGQPLDTVRVWQQKQAAQSGAWSGGQRRRGGGAAAGGPRPASALATARALVARGGVAALYRGVVYPATTIAVQSALVFQAYGAACRTLEEYRAERAEGDAEGAPPLLPPTPPPPRLLSLADTVAAGCVAGAAQCAVIVPVDLLKLRAQLGGGGGGGGGRAAPPQPPPSPRPPGHLASRAGAGLRGLYRGAAVTAARDVPSYGLYFGLYEWGQRALGGRAGADGGGSDGAAPPPPPLLSPSTATLLAGGGAGAAAWLAVYPLDVIKTRVQAVDRVDGGGGGGHGAAAPRHTFLSAARAGGLCAGAPATVARAFLINAVLWWTYEWVMVELERGGAVAAAAGGAELV